MFPPCYVALCASKAHHRLGSESVSWCLETSLFFKTLFLGWSSIPTSFVSLFVFYIFSYLLSKTMGCFSGCLMSSASIQKLFCGIYSVFKCSFDEFVGEKVISPSYSSAILGLPYFIGYWLIFGRGFVGPIWILMESMPWILSIIIGDFPHKWNGSLFNMDK